LTAALVDSAMAIAAAEALTLGEIKQRVRERHPHAADFSEDRLAARLKARGFSFKRCRLSLKKREFDVTKLSQRIVARDSKTDVDGCFGSKT
jgi:hypothetical protein